MMDHQKIFKIACELKPIYDAQQACYMAFLGEPDSPRKDSAWRKSVEAYHKALISRAPALGKAMWVNPRYLIMLMGVRDHMIIWTPDMIRNIANFERLNPNYWSHDQAVRKHNYQFPSEVAASSNL